MFRIYVPSDKPVPDGFRPDVEGLRGVAVLTVLLCHAGVPLAAGGYVGVDVFFVISGFVITRLLLAEIDRTGTISLLHFFARRAKRLLPLAATVVVATALLSSWQPLPMGAEELSRDAVAAALYVANWRFAETTVDYFAGPDQVSPLQHFWSLAIEEQFYFTWPLLLLGLAVVWTRRGRPVPRPAVALVLAVITAASLAYAVVVTADAPGAAYFSTPARVWELGLGALLAVMPLSRVPGRLASLLCWGGLAAIMVATLTFAEHTPFPGLPALVPTLGAAALIAGGAARPSRLLVAPSMQAVGRLSYALYLWHWPLLIFVGARWGPLSAAEGLIVVAVSVIPAVLSHRWIEEPLRRSKLHFHRPRLTLAYAPCCAAVVFAVAALLPLLQPSVPTLAADEVEGARVMDTDAKLQEQADGVRPNPRKAVSDRSQAHKDGCLVSERETRSERCVYGERSSDRTLVLFGDSHAMHFFPAIDVVARRQGWRLVELTKAGCPPARVLVFNRVLKREYRECDTWRRRALRRVDRMERPPLVVMSSATYYRAYDGARRLDEQESADRLREGWTKTLEELRKMGTRPVVVEDVPQPPVDIPSCVLRALDNLETCAFPRDAGLAFPHAASDAAREIPGVHLIDPTPKFCLQEVCPAVIGDVLVYRNTGHLTATYAETMAPWFARKLRTAARGHFG